jgi:hypothetical protein
MEKLCAEKCGLCNKHCKLAPAGVEVRIEIRYDGNNLRLSRFDVEYRIDGEAFLQTIMNY